MWTLVFVTLACLLEASEAQGVIYAAAPHDRGTFFTGLSEGGYNYGYNTGDGIAKVEVRRKDGSVVGSYRYFDPSGKQVIRSYIADRKGFRVLGNDLPISPNTPAAAILGAPALTAPVEGTSEFNEANKISVNLLRHQPVRQVVTVKGRRGELHNQKEILKRQRELILKQQRQIDHLQQQHTEGRTRHVIYKEQVPDISRGYVVLDSQYYYHPGGMNFDFPAGFAYLGLPVVVPPAPVAVQGEWEDKSTLAAGHTQSLGHLYPPVASKTHTYQTASHLVAGQAHSYSPKRSYIIGHA